MSVFVAGRPARTARTVAEARGAGSGSGRRRLVAWLCALSVLAAPALSDAADARRAEPAAAQGTTDATKPTAPPAPKPVPIPRISSSAEGVAATLREIEAELPPLPAVVAIEQGLESFAPDLDATLRESARAVAARSAPDRLWDIDADLQSLAAKLGAWGKTLTNRATRLEENIDRIAELQRIWNATRELARSGDAPAPIVERTEAVLSDLQRQHAQVEKRRAEILVLQDRVSQSEARITEARLALRRAVEQALESLFVRDRAPFWRSDLPAAVQEDWAAALGETLTAYRKAFQEYFEANAGRAALWIALLALAVAALRVIRVRVQPRFAVEPELRAAAWVLETPVLVALLLTMLVTPWVLPYAPRAILVLAFTAALVPTVLILRRLVERRLVPFAYTLLFFYVIDRARDLGELLPVLARVLFVLELVSAIALLAWLVHRKRGASPATQPLAPRPINWALTAARAAIAGLALALLADFVGYSRLGRFLGNAALSSAYAGVVLFVGMRILQSIATLMLATRPLRTLGMVVRARAVLERRTHRVIRWIAILWWILISLQFLALRDPVLDALKVALTTPATVGELSISLGDVLAFGVTIWAASLLSRFVRFVLQEDVFPRVRLSRGVPYALSMVLHYVLLFGGFVLAVIATGINLDRFTLLAGAFGVGAGFGLQSLVNNFVSGLVLLFERPIQVGDAIETANRSGEIREIGIRASVLRTWDGAEVIVPNSTLTTNEVVNWTLSDRQRRIEVQVGVAYGTDPEAVIALLVEVAKQHPDVLASPAPHALFVAFGDSALEFQLRAWTSRFDRWLGIRSELHVGVNRALKDANITIPFPQRDVHLKRN